MAQAAKPLKFFTAAEYLAWEEAQPERHELVEGVPYAMAGASQVHNLLVGPLRPAETLRSRAGMPPLHRDRQAKGRGEHFYYPDLMMVCAGVPPLTYYEESPCLLVEVGFDSTENINRREKF
ncbi:hypothetical protein YIM73052_01540 [Thermus antranikianii]